MCVEDYLLHYNSRDGCKIFKINELTEQTKHVGSLIQVEITSVNSGNTITSIVVPKKGKKIDNFIVWVGSNNLYVAIPLSYYQDIPQIKKYEESTVIALAVTIVILAIIIIGGLAYNLLR